MLFRIEWYDTSILFECNNLKIVEYLRTNQSDFFGALPYKIRDSDHSSNSISPDLIYVESKIDTPQVSIENGIVVIFGSYSNLIDTGSIRLIIFACFHKKLSEEKKFILHSSAIAKNDYGVIFTGTAGAGKTTAAMMMCIKNRWKFISNNSTVIGLEDNEPKILGTIREGLKLKYTSVNMYDKKLAEELFQYDRTNVKLKIMPEKLGIDSNVSKVTLQKLIMISVNEQIDTTFVQSYSDMDPYEKIRSKIYFECELSYFLRGNLLTLFDKNQTMLPTFISNLDSETTFLNRRDFIEKICSRIIVIRGKLNHIMDIVENMV